MEKRIEQERRGREPARIKGLILDNCLPDPEERIEIPWTLKNFVSLETLRMINIGLCSLKGFPLLKNLTVLDISDNRLSDGLSYIADGCPKLTSLSIERNPIKEMDSLSPLKNLADLRFVDMAGCHIAAAKNYRSTVFQILLQITYLDSLDREDKLCQEAFQADSESDAGQIFDAQDSDCSFDELGTEYGKSNETWTDRDSYIGDKSDTDTEEDVGEGPVPFDTDTNLDYKDRDSDELEESVGVDSGDEAEDADEKGWEMGEDHGDQTSDSKMQRPRRSRRLKRARSGSNSSHSGDDHEDQQLF